MALIPWNDSYAMGHGEIDKQHKHIFEIINKLYDAIQNGYDIDTATEIADDILEHAANHFEYEEGIMADASYPGLADHREEHQRVTEQAIDYREKMLDGSKSSAVRMLNFLKGWILGHLVQWDRGYKPYIQVNHEI